MNDDGSPPSGWEAHDDGRHTGTGETEERPLRPLWHRILAGVIATVLIATLVLYTALIF